MIIEYYTKHVYGNKLEYIKDKQQALAVYLFSGQKTLTLSSRQGLEDLGFKLVEVLV